MPRGRGSSTGKPLASLLTSKVFDETGDRLTPTHSKTRKGKRLRYYVSHRLIHGRGEKDNSGWRLPAPKLEALVNKLVRDRIRSPEFVASLVRDAGAEEISRIRNDLNLLITVDQTTDGSSRVGCLCLVQRLDIAPGQIGIALGVQEIAAELHIAPDRINERTLAINTGFQLRKRGVETRLVLADQPQARDETLLRNIAKAHAYFGQISKGKSFAEIAEAEGLSKRRVQQMIGLAFLAPDIVRGIFEGHQQISLTSDWLLRHEIPSDWNAQRELFSTL